MMIFLRLRDKVEFVLKELDNVKNKCKYIDNFEPVPYNEVKQ